MKVILDTSAIIYLNDFREFDEILTVPEVIEEVKDKTSKIKLSGINLKVVEPNFIAVKTVETVAHTTGDLEKLSQTDIKILALAKENGYTIVSDDRNIQNVAEKLGINFFSIFNEKISKFITWKKYCKNCKRYFDSGETCPVCGSKLVRIPVKSEKI